MFGGNLHEVGSLSENLVLNTAGKVKIRFGQKFIDLLDEKGNLNIKLPKTIKQIKSESEMKTNGFYYLDNILYAYIEGIKLPVLKQPLLSIYENNELETLPTDNNYGIVFINGKWQYAKIVTEEKYSELEKNIKTLQEKIEELENQIKN